MANESGGQCISTRWLLPSAKMATEAGGSMYSDKMVAALSQDGHQGRRVNVLSQDGRQEVNSLAATL